MAECFLEGREERRGDRGVKQRRQGASHAALPGDGQQQGLSCALQPALNAYLRSALGLSPCILTAAASGVALRGQLWEAPARSRPLRLLLPLWLLLITQQADTYIQERFLEMGLRIVTPACGKSIGQTEALSACGRIAMPVDYNSRGRPKRRFQPFVVRPKCTLLAKAELSCEQDVTHHQLDDTGQQTILLLWLGLPCFSEIFRACHSPLCCLPEVVQQQR